MKLLSAQNLNTKYLNFVARQRYNFPKPGHNGVVWVAYDYNRCYLNPLRKSYAKNKPRKKRAGC